MPTFTHPHKATKIADKRDTKWQNRHVSKTGKKEGFQGMFTEKMIDEIVRKIEEEWLRKPIFPDMLKQGKKTSSDKAFGGTSDPAKKCPTCPDKEPDIEVVTEEDEINKLLATEIVRSYGAVLESGGFRELIKSKLMESGLLESLETLMTEGRIGNLMESDFLKRLGQNDVSTRLEKHRAKQAKKQKGIQRKLSRKDISKIVKEVITSKLNEKCLNKPKLK